MSDDGDTVILSKNSSGLGGAVTYPAAAAGYAMVTPGVYRNTGAPCVVTTGFNGACDEVIRTQDIAAMGKVGGPKPPVGATHVIAELDCEIVASGANGTHELNVVFFHDLAGASIAKGYAFAAFEHTLIHAPGDWIGGAQVEVIFPLSDPAARLFTTQFFDLHAAPVLSNIQGIHFIGYIMAHL